jgi:hypothetical protein
MPKGAAARSDSTFIGMAATLLAEYRRAPEVFPTPRINALRLMLAELGMTPRARPATRTGAWSERQSVR